MRPGRSGRFSADGTYISIDGKHFKVRPCVVQQFTLDRPARTGEIVGTVTAYVLGTYGGTSITRLPELTQHFAVSVGDTDPWPSPDSAILKPLPDWPKSREVPNYLIAHPVKIPLSAFAEPYVLETSHGPTPCRLDPVQMDRLEGIVARKRRAYKGKSLQEALSWNESWEIHSRERKQLVSQTVIQDTQSASTNTHRRAKSEPSLPPVNEVMTFQDPPPHRGNLQGSHLDAHQPGIPPLSLALARPQQTVPHPPSFAAPPTPDYGWGPQWGIPQGIRIHSSHGWVPSISANQFVFVPGRIDHAMEVQYAGPPRHASYGSYPPQLSAEGYQQHQSFAVHGPPGALITQHPHFSSAPTSLVTQQQVEQQQYYVPSTPNVQYTFPTPTTPYLISTVYHDHAAGVAYDQYQTFQPGPSAFGMHQGEQMIVVTQQNVSHMPPQVRSMAHEALMYAPELVEVAAG